MTSKWYRDVWTQMRIRDLHSKGYSAKQITRSLDLDIDMVQATIKVLGMDT